MEADPVMLARKVIATHLDDRDVLRAWNTPQAEHRRLQSIECEEIIFLAKALLERVAL